MARRSMSESVKWRDSQCRWLEERQQGCNVQGLKAIREMAVTKVDGLFLFRFGFWLSKMNDLRWADCLGRGVYLTMWGCGGGTRQKTARQTDSQPANQPNCPAGPPSKWLVSGFASSGCSWHFSWRVTVARWVVGSAVGSQQPSSEIECWSRGQGDSS